MEPEFEAETFFERSQVTADPETVPAPAVRAGDTADVPVKVKKEEQEEVKLNLSAAAENDNIFDEVDGPEYVDLTYEGIAEVDGVEHFVCESLYPKSDRRKIMINTKRRL